MIRHLFIAALRSMAASKLLSAISIVGLAIGLATAILAGLMVRNDFVYERFLPGYAQVYAPLTEPGFARPGTYFILGDKRLAERARTEIPGLEAAARLWRNYFKVQRGNVAAGELGAWAEPDLARVLPFPVLQGGLADALRRPDGVVVTRGLARKYFGHENVLGQAISLDGHPMTVRAVIEDPPANATRFSGTLYASSLAAFSNFARETPSRGMFLNSELHLYLRLAPGASVAEAERAMARMVASISPKDNSAGLMRLDRLNLSDGMNAGISTRLTVTAAIGLLTLFIAGANYINLMLARAGRRQREVGLRKVCGAGRRDLMLQFLGEAFVSVAIAALLAVALVEWLAPAANTFLQTGAKLEMSTGAAEWGNPTLLLSLLAGVMLLGLCVGLYPALVLSGFRPASILKGWLHGTRGAGAVRSLLVAGQFAILTVLTIAALVVWRQQDFAAREAMRVDIDQMLIVEGVQPPAFIDEVRRLPGVRGAAVSGMMLMDQIFFLAKEYKGGRIVISPVDIDPRFFALYGVVPLAGSLPNGPEAASSLIVNQKAARSLGFATPQAAVGQPVVISGWAPLRIAAVVPDFSLQTVEMTEEGIVLYPPLGFDTGVRMGGGQNPGLAHIKLTGGDVPETLAAIDRLWRATGGEGPIKRYFLDAHMQERYLHLFRRAQLFAGFAGVAIFLACLGLVGIAVATADRRTKEIGVRKAMGATSPQVTALLLWQFSRPVLLANLIAWPVAFWAMQRWLSGFASHVELGPAPFLAAGALSLMVAVLTVLGQAILVARQKPVVALRYE